MDLGPWVDSKEAQTTKKWARELAPNKCLAKMHNHPLGFDSVANRPLEVLILQYNHLGFFNW
jgi:hypothetical protein